MKNVIIAILALAAIAEGAILFQNKDHIGLGGAPEASGRIITRNFEGEVIAKADGREVKEQEIKERLNFITQGRGDQIDLNKMDAKGLEAVTKEAAVQRKILEKAYEAGVQNDKELQNRIDDLVENIYKEKFLEKIATEGVTDEKIKITYDELVGKAKSSQQYKVRHILVRSEAEAKAAEEKLKTQSFDSVAKTTSVDKQSAVRGGDLGYIFPEEFVVEFSDAVKKLGKNETSGPVKTEFGWHIIKVEDMKDAEIVTFDQAKPRIEKQLGSESVKNYIEGLSNQIQVELVKAPAAADATTAATDAAAPAAPAPSAVAPTEPAPAVAPAAGEVK